jgi:hypothetical protein
MYWIVAQGSGDARVRVTTIPIMYLRSVPGWNRDFLFLASTFIFLKILRVRTSWVDSERVTECLEYRRESNELSPSYILLVSCLLQLCSEVKHNLPPTSVLHRTTCFFDKGSKDSAHAVEVCTSHFYLVFEEITMRIINQLPLCVLFVDIDKKIGQLLTSSCPRMCFGMCNMQLGRSEVLHTEAWHSHTLTGGLPQKKWKWTGLKKSYCRFKLWSKVNPTGK